jgi:hypothetical protein
VRLSQGNAAEAFAKPPDPGRPSQGPHDGRSDQAREEKPDTHSELDQGEPGAQRYRVLCNEAGEEVDGRRPMLVGPPPAAASIFLAKAAVNMNGCSCSTASTSHSTRG